VVPVVLRRFYSVADKNNVSVDIGLSLLRLIGSHVLVQKLEPHGLSSIKYERKSRFRKCGDPNHWHLLHVRAVVPCGLEPIKGKLGSDILRRDIAAALASTTSFKQIVGQETHVSTNALGIDGLHRLKGRRREAGRR